MIAKESDLPITWANAYHSEWDTRPAAYLQAQIVKSGRSRRLGFYNDPLKARKGYIGVYHLPRSPGSLGDTRFFLSLFVQRRTLGLHSYATMHDLLEVLAAFHVHGTPWGKG